MILLLSGTTVTWAHHSLLGSDRSGLLRGLALTVFLGLCFTSLQAFEYSNAEFHFTGGIYPSTFFMATGFHGFHVIIGTTFLIVCLGRAWLGQFRPDHHFGFEAAAWYWHFVDVVWLFLFVCIYWWGGGGAAEPGREWADGNRPHRVPASSRIEIAFSGCARRSAVAAGGVALTLPPCEAGLIALQYPAV